MPKYRALRDILIAHEGRKVAAGDEFVTDFPKVKVGDELVDMKLGDNIELLPDEKPAKTKPAPADKPPAEPPAA